MKFNIESTDPLVLIYGRAYTFCDETALQRLPASPIDRLPFFKKLLFSHILCAFQLQNSAWNNYSKLNFWPNVVITKGIAQGVSNIGPDLDRVRKQYVAKIVQNFATRELRRTASKEKLFLLLNILHF